MKYKLKLLNEVLFIWEDMNKAAMLDSLVGGFAKRFPLTQEEQKTVKTYEHLPGSEVNENFKLALPIKNYDDLSKLLEAGNIGSLLNRDPNEFLISIPASFLVTHANKFDFTSQHVGALFLAPYFLKRWSEYKKVCVVKKRKLLEDYAESTDGMSLENLPYDSFLLKVEEPFIYHKEYEGSVIHLEIEHIIVCKIDKRVHFWAIPNEIMDRSFDEDEIALVEKSIKKAKEFSAFLSRVGMVPISKNMLKGGKFFREMMELFGKIPPELFKRIYNTDGYALHYSVDAVTCDNPQTSPSLFNLGAQEDPSTPAKLVGEIMITVLGMCKALAAQHSEISSEVITASEAPALTDDHRQDPLLIEEDADQESLEWFEIPEHTLDFFRTYKHKGSIKVNIAKGSEKGPHPRREHQRRIYAKDGTLLKTVPVRKSFIHKERALQGTPLKTGRLIT